MKIVVLIPVLGRPGSVAPVLESLRLATPGVRPLFLCSKGDDAKIREVKASGADYLVSTWLPDRADFAKKINLAFTETDEPWLLQAADDLRFRPGWDLHALNTAHRHSAGVIGTNDLGNPLVKKGRHSTHTMFSRDYIEQGGGPFDGSGIVFSERYDHQWCDNEFCETAMLRGQWAFSHRSVIEHMHPHWGKAKMDPTYEKATRETREDRALFAKRMKMARNKIARSQMHERRMQAREQRLAMRRARRA